MAEPITRSLIDLRFTLERYILSVELSPLGLPIRPNLDRQYGPDSPAPENVLLDSDGLDKPRGLPYIEVQVQLAERRTTSIGNLVNRRNGGRRQVQYGAVVIRVQTALEQNLAMPGYIGRALIEHYEHNRIVIEPAPDNLFADLIDTSRGESIPAFPGDHPDVITLTGTFQEVGKAPDENSTFISLVRIPFQYWE